MLRLSELKLPLDHAAADLRAAILARLGIADADLLGVSVFRRAVDARKKSAILLAYAMDLELRDEAAVLVIQDGPGPIDSISRALDNLTVSTDPLKKLPPFVAVAVVGLVITVDAPDTASTPPISAARPAIQVAMMA